jgi:hypothetical protein
MIQISSAKQTTPVVNIKRQVFDVCSKEKFDPNPPAISTKDTDATKEERDGNLSCMTYRFVCVGIRNSNGSCKGGGFAVEGVRVARRGLVQQVKGRCA